MQWLFAMLLFFSIPGGPLAAAAESITGVFARPFPVIMNLGYTWSRAEAWLAALRKAASRLPAATEDRLRNMGLEPTLAQLAMCACVFPVAAVTPEDSPRREIKVFLDGRGDVNTVLRQPEAFLEKMALLVSMRTLLAEMASQWPASVSAARDRLTSLEKLDSALDGYWLLLNEPEEIAGNLERLAQKLNSDVVVQLMLARSLLAQGRFQAAIAAAGDALELCQARSGAARRNRNLWHYLSAEIYYIRGLAHWRMAQVALAETDFGTAVAIMEKSPLKTECLFQSLLALGEIERAKTDYPAMCAFFQRACAYGACQSLAREKRLGNCPDKAE